MSRDEYEPKYIERLADVYLEKYHKEGASSAKKWYDNFLNNKLRGLIKPAIAKKLAEQAAKE